MPHAAIVTFTARPLEEILADRGSRDWRLDPARARQAAYLVCTQNQNNQGLRTPTAPHGAAFLIGRVAGIVPSPERPERWLIKISDYIALNPPVPNIWGKSGNLRYPVWYTTLEALGIDLDTLPPFTPLPPAGLAEGPIAPIMAPAQWTPASHRRGRQSPAGEPDPVRRLDAILAQIDRIPDAPEPFDPLAWDGHGLPQ